MVKVEGHRIIRAPVQKVFQLVSRLDSHTRVTGLWLAADLLERRSNSLTVHYRGYFGGIPIESVQKATLHPPQRIEFKQSRGGLKVFQGKYALKAVDGDTELSLLVEAETGIALITEASAQRVVHAYVERTLQKIKFIAERDLPRAVRRAPPEEPAAATTPPPSPPPAPAAAPKATEQPAGTVRKKRRRRRRRRRGNAGTAPHGTGAQR